MHYRDLMAEILEAGLVESSATTLEAAFATGAAPITLIDGDA